MYFPFVEYLAAAKNEDIGIVVGDHMVDPIHS